MGAVTALFWIMLRADAATPSADVGRGWSVSAVADASLAPLLVYPDYENGVRLTAGFRVAHSVGHNVTVAAAGRAGGTFVDDWRPLFEGAAELLWRPVTLELRAGVRHDERLRREGALAIFRDPTGRTFVGASVLPVRKQWFAAGAAVEYEGPMPGSGRLPSGVRGTLVGRIQFSR